jgi:glycosyltransferase involved in cell wall biosynthesis
MGKDPKELRMAEIGIRKGDRPRTALLHYSAPPVVGGVEAVIAAQARTFSQFGYPVGVITGRGEAGALPGGGFSLLPEMDSQHPRVLEISTALEQGQVPEGFARLVKELAASLSEALAGCQNVIVHNVFTKHFNLPLTAALYALLETGPARRWIAWCHDATWTSPSSRPKVRAGYPWDLLRTFRPEVTYVAVSRQRQEELAGLYGCDPGRIQVVYNGVDPELLLGLSPEGQALAGRLELLESDLVLLMPVRVTQAKNIELALQVVAALKRRGKRPRLVLTGPPDPHDAASMAYFEELLALRRELGLAHEMRFVFEAGPHPGQSYRIDQPVVAELYRLSDLLFMPSRREGFGMPVLEAALVGLPVISTSIPASVEIGDGDLTLVGVSDDPEAVAEQILRLLEGDPAYRLRVKVRQRYTWEAIFRGDIEPLLA